MAQKILQHLSTGHFPLAANAANTTLEVSTADATIINTIRLAFGGSVRMLVYSPATYTYTTPYFETVLIDGAPTAGVFTVAALTSEAQYTTANGAKITFCLCVDGECEQYGT